MTSVKAALTVILKANEVVVAEIEDAILWQKVLTAINSGMPNFGIDPPPNISGETMPPTNPDQSKAVVEAAPVSTPLDQLARQLGIDRALVEGGCSPTIEAPHILLNPHCWEEMKKQLPQRGPGAVAPIVAAATTLALWFQVAGLGNPTQAQAQAVLNTINLFDPNASRSIRNATWLQIRSGGQFVLNPAEISKAGGLMKCFCIKEWKTWKEAASS
jgi:hypothetical protein